MMDGTARARCQTWTWRDGPRIMKDLLRRLTGRRRDERAMRRSHTLDHGRGLGRDRVLPAGTPAEAGRLGSSRRGGAQRAADRLVTRDSQLYAGLPGQGAAGTALAAVEDGPAPPRAPRRRAGLAGGARSSLAHDPRDTPQG